jgi:hypothetical protein
MPEPGELSLGELPASPLNPLDGGRERCLALEVIEHFSVTQGLGGHAAQGVG